MEEIIVEEDETLDIQEIVVETETRIRTVVEQPIEDQDHESESEI